VRNELGSSKWLALAGILSLGASSLFAQDSGPLIDLLVKKGIVTDQEGEQLRADLIKDFAANSSAGKLNLSSSLTELRISGDVRVRYEYRQGQSLERATTWIAAVSATACVRRSPASWAVTGCSVSGSRTAPAAVHRM
jgi:polyhydroxyalkanoate synthesis regulator phasin